MRICMLTFTDVRSDLRIRKEAITLSSRHDVSVCSHLGNMGVDQEGLPFRLVDIPVRSRRWPSNPFFWMIKYAEFVVRGIRSVRAERPDVVHGHEVVSALPSWIAARTAGARFVYDAHELELDRDVRINRIPWLNFLLGLWVRFLLRRADAVICASGLRAEIMLAEYGVGARPVPIVNATPRDGLPVDRIPAWPFPGAGKQECKTIIYQGAVSSGRGIARIVEAMSILSDEYRLIMVGDGDALERVRERSLELGVHERIHFSGRIPADEVPGWIVLADAGVVIYRDTCRNNRYCAPNKLYDYCALGVPVVASDVIGLRSILEMEPVGTLFDPEDPNSLASAVSELLSDEQKYEEYRKAAVSLRERANWEQEEERLFELYDSLEPRPS